jgi:hypothetical protein
MWRAFGGSNSRVALVFAVPRFSGGALALNIMFSPVAYLTEEETHAVIHDVIKKISENGAFLRSVDRQVIIATVFNMLLAAVTCLKHEGFKEEREWRVIYTPKINASLLMETSTEVIGGLPQPIHKIPLDKKVSPALQDLEFSSMFDSLIVGPSQYPWAMYEAFVTELTKAGVSNAGNRVVNSGIPIRS